MGHQVEKSGFCHNSDSTFALVNASRILLKYNLKCKTQNIKPSPKNSTASQNKAYVFIGTLRYLIANKAKFAMYRILSKITGLGLRQKKYQSVETEPGMKHMIE